MYECPNCGGNLKFEIPSQKLFCAYCDTRIEPEAVTKETDTLENDCFEVNVFLCPQCGGRMISGDNDATAFCSYCGAANILSTRISQEKRPKYIIPFKKTKEDCKKAYAQRLRRAIFAPRELKDPKFIDSFRGIYMPYWLYHITHQGPVTFKGQLETRKGSYRYIDHYDLKADLDAEILGLSHDASANFHDTISQELAPFNTADIKEFTPSYLSGFYADIPDVDSDTYLTEASSAANSNTFARICQNPVFKKHHINTNVSSHNLGAIMHTQCENMDNAMFPVWFLSYRNQNRVAYAAVNGQTGKVATDIPVDPKRYLIVSLILALPIFLLLNLFLTLRPSVLLMLCGAISMVASGIIRSELKAIYAKETYADDKGMQQKYDSPKRRQFSRKRKQSNDSGFMMMTLFIAFVGVSGGLYNEAPEYASRLVWLAILVAMAIISFSGLLRRLKAKDAKGGLGLILPLAAVSAGALIGLYRPVSDLWYYGGALLILVSVVFSIIEIIQNYNRLATRRLPQFDKKGGEDNA